MTDALGVATFAYEGLYGGEYTVVASVPPDDGDQLDAASAEADLTVDVQAWEEAPVIIQASEAVGRRTWWWPIT